MDLSPWPLIMSLCSFNMVGSLLYWFFSKDFQVLEFFFSLGALTLGLYGWSRDISQEGFRQGNHTLQVQMGLKLGMILFIVSEVFFFLSFFWSYFFYSLNPAVDLGSSWPPLGIVSVAPLGPALLGTLILISSGVTVTWSHHSLMESTKKESLISLGVTILLGVAFTALQAMEYYEAWFSINDSVYGSIFFLATGFHGFHVVVGSLLLLVSLLRLHLNQLSKSHHIGYEASVWYWHFVDVVWLFLYVFMYWWGG